MDENQRARRSFFRFGIRDLLWTMIVLAMGLGWYTDRQHLSAHHNTSLAMLCRFLAGEGLHVTKNPLGFTVLKESGDMVILYQDLD